MAASAGFLWMGKPRGWQNIRSVSSVNVCGNQIGNKEEIKPNFVRRYSTRLGSSAFRNADTASALSSVSAPLCCALHDCVCGAVVDWESMIWAVAKRMVILHALFSQWRDETALIAAAFSHRLELIVVDGLVFDRVTIYRQAGGLGRDA